MIIIFSLGIRAWVNNNMIYTNNFTVISGEPDTQKILLWDNNKKIETNIYMIKTNSSVLNGDIYEYDIIKDQFDNFYIVYFNQSIGSYLGINGSKRLTLGSLMLEYEIIGNVLEDPELLNNIDYSEMAEDINFLLKSIVPPIDFNKDLIDMGVIDEVDFDEKEAAKELEAIRKKETIDIELTLDEGVKSIPFKEGDITDAYVDWVYMMYEKSMEIPDKVEYLEGELDVINIYAADVFDSSQSKGSYSFLIKINGDDIWDSGDFNNATKQLTDLKMLLKAICSIKVPSQIKLYSTSKYAIFPFTKGWIYQWKENGWAKEPNGPKIKNYKLFSKLLKLTEIHEIEFKLQKDHNIPDLKRCYEVALAHSQQK